MKIVTARIAAPISFTERAARTKCLLVLTAIVGAVAGCATQDQLHQTEVQQGQAVQALRAGADRSESVVAGLRTEIERTQESMHGLEVALTDARARTDAAQVQADSALATTREFLANLLLESRLQAQQRLLEQNASALNDASRRLYAVEAGLQEAGPRSTLLEAKAKAGQDADDGLSRQLATLRKQVEETRSVISSAGLLQMLREIEDVRRNSASLHGTIEELRKAQADSAAQARNYYLDLDSRVRQMKQPAPQAVGNSESRSPAASEPAANQ